MALILLSPLPGWLPRHQQQETAARVSLRTHWLRWVRFYKGFRMGAVPSGPVWFAPMSPSLGPKFGSKKNPPADRRPRLLSFREDRGRCCPNASVRFRFS